MSTIDYAVDIGLIAIIFLQVRPHELTARSARLALIAMIIVASTYLRPFTIADNDALLIAILIASGAILGTASGLSTHVWRSSNGTVYSQTGVIGVATWIAGMGFRLWFAYYASHSGATSITRFSQQHGITGATIWTAAFVFMAFAQVITRVGILQARRVMLTGTDTEPVRVNNRQTHPDAPTI